MSNSLYAFRATLGSRIDALDVLLREMDRGGDREDDLIRLCRSLHDAAAAAGAEHIASVAAALSPTTGPTLRDLAKRLLQLLRQEARLAQRREPTVLVIGGPSSLDALLQEPLHSAGHRLLHVATGAEGRQVLRDQPASCILVSLVLPDMDGRTLLHQIKSSARTAAIPVLVLSEKNTAALCEDVMLHGADSCIEAGSEATLLQWVSNRLRRTPEAARTARRDSLTGLLNRPAFREAFEHQKRECRHNQEPLALGLLSLESERQRLQAMDPVASEEVMQTFGLMISNLLRQTDIIARWDTYEFVTLFPGQDHSGGSRALEKVLQQVNERPFKAPDGSDLLLRPSAGVTVVAPETGMEEAAAAAERYAFAASSYGGGKVVSDRSAGSLQKIPRVLLLIEDPLTARVIGQLLEKEGFSVAHFSSRSSPDRNGWRGLRYHLMIIDEDYPPGGGFELLKELRRDSANSRMPIVMLMKTSSEQTVGQALELGCTDFITRPIVPAGLARRMRRLVSRGMRPGSDDDGRTRLLMVDDDVNALMVAASAIDRAGAFRIFLARGADDGLARYEDVMPRVLVVSQPLAPAGAADFIRRVSERFGDCLADVVLSADAPLSKDVTFALPIKGVLKKPFNAVLLGDELCRVLGISSKARTAQPRADQLSTEIKRIMSGIPR